MPPPTHHRVISKSDTLESLSALLTQLYTLHLLLPSSSPIHSSTPSSLYISQPPHSPSPSLLSRWKEAGMSEIVMEVLRGLPYLSHSRTGEERGDREGNGEGKEESGTGNREVAPDTLALDYLDEEGEALEVWKDPFCLSATSTSTSNSTSTGTAVGKEMAGGKEKRKQGYLGNAIPLTSCIGNDGCLLLLDLDSCMYFTFFSPCLPFLTLLLKSLFYMFLLRKDCVATSSSISPTLNHSSSLLPKTPPLHLSLHEQRKTEDEKTD
jgi:hypothetical protein